MSKNLIIVESPNKIKTIQGYVGSDYDIVATYGHLRELNKKKGYDDEYNPIWQVIGARTKNTKQPIIDEIRRLAETADKIYLATDPDREGEAISWHVWDLLDEKDREKCQRITFNEVTKSAILNSIKNQSDIDWNLVYSQFARRIMDRIIGYKLSSYAKKMLKAISAGRVQSVALLFIVERELERRAFVPVKWWEINADILEGVKVNYIYKGKKFKPYETSSSTCFRFALENEALEVFNDLSKEYKLVKHEGPKQSIGDSYHPLTTDKLLQYAASNLGWGSAKTTTVAQRMFEGLEVGGTQMALISYPRTDSERLSDEFVSAAKTYITKRFGADFFSLPKKQKSNANVQDAHEAIRPVNPNLTPEQIEKLVPADIYKLYNLVWTRTMASLMQPPLYNNFGLYFENNNHEFYTSHRTIAFDGYLALPSFRKVKEELNKVFPSLEIGQVFKVKNNNLEVHEKQPPPYYTEATLIAALKDAGVGRPSTYSTMARISEQRGYVIKDKQKLIPNDIGMELIAELTKNFPHVISKAFTAKMETDLDKIADGDEFWKNEIINFVPKFDAELKQAYETTVKKEDEKVGRKCPDCGGDLVYKISKYKTKFIACSNFPACKHTESIDEPKLLDEKCPECGSQLIMRKNKRGQEFIGCSNYPKCKYIKGAEARQHSKKTTTKENQ